MLDHKVLVANFPSNGSELLAVSGHHEQLVTTQDPVETHFYSGSFLRTLLSFLGIFQTDHGMTGQMGAAALPFFN